MIPPIRHLATISDLLRIPIFSINEHGIAALDDIDTKVLEKMITKSVGLCEKEISLLKYPSSIAGPQEPHPTPARCAGKFVHHFATLSRRHRSFNDNYFHSTCNFLVEHAVFQIS